MPKVDDVCFIGLSARPQKRVLVPVVVPKSQAGVSSVSETDGSAGVKLCNTS